MAAQSEISQKGVQINIWKIYKTSNWNPNNNNNKSIEKSEIIKTRFVSTYLINKVIKIMWP